METLGTVQGIHGVSSSCFIAKIMGNWLPKGQKSLLDKAATKKKKLNKTKSPSPSRLGSFKVPRVEGRSNILIAKRISKGTDIFQFDRAFNAAESIQSMYKESIQGLVRAAVMENRSVWAILSGAAKSKKGLWLGSIGEVDGGLVGCIINNIFEVITAKQLVEHQSTGSVRVSLMSIANCTQEVLDLLDDQSQHSQYAVYEPSQVQHNLTEKEIFDLDDFLEVLEISSYTSILSRLPPPHSGRTIVCRIRIVQSNNQFTDIHLLNLQDIESISRECEDYYVRFMHEIRELGSLQFGGSIGLAQLLASPQLHSNSSLLMLSPLLPDSAIHLANLATLKLGRRLQSAFQSEEELFQGGNSKLMNPPAGSTLKGLSSIGTSPYNTNNTNEQQFQQQQQFGQLFTNQMSNQMTNSQSSQQANNSNNINKSSNNNNAPPKLQIWRNSNPNLNPNNYYNNLNSSQQMRSSNFNQSQQLEHVPSYANENYGHRMNSSQQEEEEYQEDEESKHSSKNQMLLRGRQKSSKNSLNYEELAIEKELTQMEESFEHPPFSNSAFFTKWVKDKAEMIEQILTSIGRSVNIDNETKRNLLDKVLVLKSELQHFHEIQSPRDANERQRKDRRSNELKSSQERRQMKSPKGFREIRTSSTPNLKQHDKLFEYFETPRFELDGGRRFAEHKRLSFSGSDSNTKMSRNSSIKSAALQPSLKSPGSRNASVLGADTFSNYYSARNEEEAGWDNSISKDELKALGYRLRKDPSRKVAGNGHQEKKKKSLSKISSKGLTKSKKSSTSKTSLNKPTTNISVLSKRSILSPTRSVKSVMSSKSGKSMGQQSILSGKSLKSAKSQKSMKSIKSVKSILSTKSAKSIKSTKSVKSTKSTQPRRLSGITSKSSISRSKTPKNHDRSLSKSKEQIQSKSRKSIPLSSRFSQSKNPLISRKTSAPVPNLSKKRSSRSINNSDSKARKRSKSSGSISRKVNKDASILKGIKRADSSRSRSLSHSRRTSTSKKSSASHSPKATTPKRSRRRANSRNHYDSINEPSQLSNLIPNNNGNRHNNNMDNYAINQQETGYGQLLNTENQLRQGIRSQLKALRDVMQSSSSESDYEFFEKVGALRPTLQQGKSNRFQERVKEFCFGFETEHQFFLSQQDKPNVVDLLKQYHRLLLKSVDVEKLLGEQVRLNEELQKESECADQRFSMLRKKHMKKKREKNLLQRELDAKRLEFDQMDQKERESSTKAAQAMQKLSNATLKCEQQEKMIKSLEAQLEQVQNSYNKRSEELEETMSAQQIRAQQLEERLAETLIRESQLKTELTKKAAALEVELKKKGEQQERELVMHGLSLKTLRVEKSTELQLQNKEIENLRGECEGAREELKEANNKLKEGRKRVRESEMIANQRSEQLKLAENSLEEVQNRLSEMTQQNAVLQLRLDQAVQLRKDSIQHNEQQMHFKDQQLLQQSQVMSKQYSQNSIPQIPQVLQQQQPEYFQSQMQYLQMQQQQQQQQQAILQELGKYQQQSQVPQHLTRKSSQQSLLLAPKSPRKQYLLENNSRKSLKDESYQQYTHASSNANKDENMNNFNSYSFQQKSSDQINDPLNPTARIHNSTSNNITGGSKNNKPKDEPASLATRTQRNQQRLSTKGSHSSGSRTKPKTPHTVRIPGAKISGQQTGLASTQRVSTKSKVKRKMNRQYQQKEQKQMNLDVMMIVYFIFLRKYDQSVQ